MKYYSLYKHNDYTFLLCATLKGLTNVDLYENQKLSHMNENETILKPYVHALDTYFKTGMITDVPFDIDLTPFQKLVLYTLIGVPSGSTTTYQDLAKMIKKPKAARAVGGALGKNPLLIFIPCHRVIRKDKSIGGFSSNPKLKPYLINFEANI